MTEQRNGTEKTLRTTKKNKFLLQWQSSLEIFLKMFLLCRIEDFRSKLIFPSKLNKVARTELMQKQISISQGQIDLHNAKLLKILASV